MASSWRRETALDQFTLRYLGRRVSHLTPRYALDLALVVAFERRHPGAPWLTREAISILGQALRPSDRGLEYGSGRSTRWFAVRTAGLISIEANPVWFGSVQAQLTSADLAGRVDYRLIPADETRQPDPHRAAYLAAAEGLPSTSLDYVVVDGIYRDACALRAVRLVKPGGFLIVDNINWYVPSPSRSPLSARRVASSSWDEFLRLVGDWRLIWTSTGVTDTGLWIRTG